MWSELNPEKDHPASRHKPESSVSTFCPQLEVIVVCFIILPGARAAATVNRILSGYMIIYNKSWFVNSNPSQTFELAYLLLLTSSCYRHGQQTHDIGWYRLRRNRWKNRSKTTIFSLFHLGTLTLC